MTVLNGLRIIELAQGLSGPYCAQMAADMGAEVLKIEPLSGDYTRQWGPPFQDGESVTFTSLNRNKRSVALDIEHPAGRKALRALLRQADVLLEDLSPAEAERFGLTYDENRRDNPRLIQCHVDYFGDLGPRKDHPGAELPVQAMLDYPGGLGSIGDPPLRVGCDLGSMNASVFAFQGLLAALLYRDATGEAQRVAISAAGSLAFLKSFILAAPSDPDEWGGFHLDSWTKPRDYGYQTKDGAVFMDLRFRGESERSDYEQFLREMGLEHMLADPRFADSRDVAGTGRYGHELKAIWEEKLSRFTSAEIVALLRGHGANGFEITNYRTIAEHPQVAALGIVREVPRAGGGTFRAIGNPWNFGPGGERATDAAPPALGRDTEAALAEAGHDSAAIAELRRLGVIR